MVNLPYLVRIIHSLEPFVLCTPCGESKRNRAL
jgi:hypothetical protein